MTLKTTIAHGLAFACVLFFSAASLDAGSSCIGCNEQLYAAVAHGDHGAVKMHLGHGAEPNYVYRFKEVTFPKEIVRDITVLYLAVQKGNLDIVRTLLGAGADQNKVLIYRESVEGKQVKYYKGTPLMCAAFQGNITCVQLLLNRGADPNKKDSWGLKASDYAEATKHTEVKAMLLIAEEGEIVRSKL